jgi:hypothetical protein
MTAKHMMAKNNVVRNKIDPPNNHNQGKLARGVGLGNRGYMREHSGDERRGASN